LGLEGKCLNSDLAAPSVDALLVYFFVAEVTALENCQEVVSLRLSLKDLQAKLRSEIAFCSNARIMAVACCFCIYQ
jgi:hypothetical protein